MIFSLIKIYTMFHVESHVENVFTEKQIALKNFVLKSHQI